MRRAAAVVGLLAAAWAVAIPWGFGAVREGYHHTSQFISELGEEGGPHAAAVNYLGFLPQGLAVWVFLALDAGCFPRGWVKGVGVAGLAGVGLAYLIAAVFPCDPGCPATGSVRQQVHNLGGLAEYGGAVIGLAALALAFRADPAWRGVWRVTLAAAVTVAAGFVLMQFPAEAAQKGLWQRVCEAAIFGWIAVVSVRLLSPAWR